MTFAPGIFNGNVLCPVRLDTHAATTTANQPTLNDAAEVILARVCACTVACVYVCVGAFVLMFYWEFDDKLGEHVSLKCSLILGPSGFRKYSWGNFRAP